MELPALPHLWYAFTERKPRAGERIIVTNGELIGVVVVVNEYRNEYPADRLEFLPEGIDPVIPEGINHSEITTKLAFEPTHWAII